VSETGRHYPKALRWVRSPRHRGSELTLVDTAPVGARLVRHRLLLTNVRCMIDGAADSVAGTATPHLVLTNDSDYEIEYEVESVKVTIQHRVAEMIDTRGVTLVPPGQAAVIRCPSIRAVDRTGPSAGNIDYVIVYGHPDATVAQRYRRQHGVWFRFEAADDTVRVRFVERYDEDDPAT
jgi:hypothetical protein